MKEILSQVIENKSLTKLSLSKSCDPAIIRTTGRLTEMKGQLYVTLERFYTDGKARHENIPAEKAAQVLSDLIPEYYKEMNILTSGGECRVLVSKKGKVTVMNRIKQAKAAPVELSHNRQKQYILPADEPVDFLVALGVQDENGRIFDKKRSKFRQINRFLEMVSDVEGSIVSGDDLYILDLCCGKSYLSFAVYYYFTAIKGYPVTMDCVDLKQDVIEYCQGVAQKLGYSGLHITAGDIRSFEVRRQPDLTVSLHACDIATDIVLSKGIDSGSRVILSTPCCHHEMMHQLRRQGKATDFLLEHSILKQKFADAATDALRCQVLQLHGYEVQAMELIDPEETPKNVLIRAVKGRKLLPVQEEKLRREYKTICDLLGVRPYLGEQYDLL